MWLLAAARLSPGPALALTAALLVGIPLALTARFSGALRRVDPSATFAGNLLGFAGITALTLLALALALARPTLSRELLSVGAHSHAPTPLWRAAHTVGLALQPPPPAPVTPAPVTPAPAATLDAGAPPTRLRPRTQRSWRRPRTHRRGTRWPRGGLLEHPQRLGDGPRRRRDR